MITFTDRGAEKVKEFLASQGADIATSGLRVGVRGGGCSGFQYALAFDTRARRRRDLRGSRPPPARRRPEPARTSGARSSTTSRASRAPASRSRTRTSSPPAAAAPPSASRRRKRSPRSRRRAVGRAGRPRLAGSGSTSLAAALIAGRTGRRRDACAPALDARVSRRLDFFALGVAEHAAGAPSVRRPRSESARGVATWRVRPACLPARRDWSRTRVRRPGVDPAGRWPGACASALAVAIFAASARRRLRWPQSSGARDWARSAAGGRSCPGRPSGAATSPAVRARALRRVARRASPAGPRERSAERSAHRSPEAVARRTGRRAAAWTGSRRLAPPRTGRTSRRDYLGRADRARAGRRGGRRSPSSVSTSLGRRSGGSRASPASEPQRRLEQENVMVDADLSQRAPV